MYLLLSFNYSCLQLIEVLLHCIFAHVTTVHSRDELTSDGFDI